MQPCTGRGLMELHQLLTFLEPPKARRDRAHIQRIRRYVQQVVQHARDFGEQHADPLAALRHLDAKEFLGGERERVLLAHRRNVIEPIEIRHRLHIRLVFNQLLGAAMQQADMRIRALHDFAIHLQDQPENAMRGWMLRSEIYRVAVDLDDFGRGRTGLDVWRLAHRLYAFVSAGGCTSAARAVCTFSSPGRVVIPSHGERKSNERKSCVRCTGS